jgi:hypothetical protein
MKTITSIKAWMLSATTHEQELLADKAGTTKAHLYQLSGGYRQTSAALAGRIEAAAAEMHKASKGRLPRIVRTDLCDACRACPYASKALGERAVISEFPIVSNEFEGVPV